MNDTRYHSIPLVNKNKFPMAYIRLGVNWGCIKKNRIIFSKREMVDLDLGCCIFDKNGWMMDKVDCSNFNSQNFSILHSGDDSEGDLDGDDKEDNESISIEIDKLSEETMHIAFYLRIASDQNFSDIPHATVALRPKKDSDKGARLYEITKDPSFEGCRAMILGFLRRRKNVWHFELMGEPTRDDTVDEIVRTITHRFL